MQSSVPIPDFDCNATMFKNIANTLSDTTMRMFCSLYFPYILANNQTKQNDYHGVSIFFLSERNSCRSQMAEAILRNFDSELEIYSAGLDPADHISPIAIEVMKEIGIDIQPVEPRRFDEFADRRFTYLITVGESTHEELDIPTGIKYERKLHLGFRSPYKNSKSHDEIRQKCREVRDELVNELEYFYFRIIKKSVC